MIVRQILTGGDRNFGYVVGDKEGGSGVLIDPSYNPALLVQEGEKLSLEIEYIFCTHNHFDHTNGNERIRERTGKKPLFYGDVTAKGVKLADGVTLPLGDLSIRIIHTPGHTNDSMCLHIGDSVFTGDTLFVGKIGGTWSHEAALTEYDVLHKKLMTLPPETVVYPGHNYGVAPASTIGLEKKTNPFILQPDFEAFLHLKNTWAEYKLKHGIK